MRSSNGAAAFTHVLLPSEAWWGSPDHYIALYRVVTHSEVPPSRIDFTIRNT